MSASIETTTRPTIDQRFIEELDTPTGERQ
jgi:hypothetical protein